MTRYRVALATHWSLHPRDVDEMTCAEFDHFAWTADKIAEEHKRQQREAERQRQQRRVR